MVKTETKKSCSWDNVVKLGSWVEEEEMASTSTSLREMQQSQLSSSTTMMVKWMLNHQSSIVANLERTDLPGTHHWSVAISEQESKHGGAKANQCTSKAHD